MYRDVTPNTGKAKGFVIDSSKGDEFQLNGYTESKFNADGSLKTGQVLSFMDILNHVVVLQTQRRRYDAYDAYGEQYVNKQTMDA